MSDTAERGYLVKEPGEVLSALGVPCADVHTAVPVTPAHKEARKNAKVHHSEHLGDFCLDQPETIRLLT